MNGRRSQQLPVVAPLKPLPRRSVVPEVPVPEVAVKPRPRNVRKKTLVDLPEEIEEYRQSIADFIEPLREKYLEAEAELSKVNGKREKSIKKMIKIDNKIEQHINEKINQYFHLVGRVPVKNNRLFSLPNELLIEIVLYLDLQSLFCTTFLSPNLFFKLQGKKKMKFDTVKVTYSSYGVCIVQVKRGMDTYTLQVVSQLDWKARMDKSLQPPPKQLKKVGNDTLCIPARPTLPCFLKNLIPAKTVRQLIVRPRDKDLFDEMGFFNQLFASAVFFESEELFAVLPCKLSQETLDEIVACRRNHLEVKFAFHPLHWQPQDLMLSVPPIQKHINWFVKLELTDKEAILQYATGATQFLVDKAWNMFERWTTIRGNDDYYSEFVYLQHSDDYSTLEKRITTYCRRKGYQIGESDVDGNREITKNEGKEKRRRIVTFVFNEQHQMFCVAVSTVMIFHFM